MRSWWALAPLVAIVAGCATIEYGPAGGRPIARYAYSEKLVEGTRYVLTIAGPANAGMADMRLMWDRRARELCGGETFSRHMFRAERPTVLYSMYGGSPGAPILQGFLDCSGAPVTAPPEG
jgi:hypothetical protein